MTNGGITSGSVGLGAGGASTTAAGTSSGSSSVGSGSSPSTSSGSSGANSTDGTTYTGSTSSRAFATICASVSPLPRRVAGFDSRPWSGASSGSPATPGVGNASSARSRFFSTQDANHMIPMHSAPTIRAVTTANQSIFMSAALLGLRVLSCLGFCWLSEALPVLLDRHLAVLDGLHHHRVCDLNGGVVRQPVLPLPACPHVRGEGTQELHDDSPPPSSGATISLNRA